MKSEELNISKYSNLKPYEELEKAIVLQSLRDYREAVKKLSRGRKNRDAQDTKDECLRFFRSKWFSLLTDLDPEFLIRRLDEEVTA